MVGRDFISNATIFDFFVSPAAVHFCAQTRITDRHPKKTTASISAAEHSITSTWVTLHCEICSRKIRVSMDNFKDNDRRSLYRAQTDAPLAKFNSWNRFAGFLRVSVVHGYALW
jgi:hypothetical protein